MKYIYLFLSLLFFSSCDLKEKKEGLKAPLSINQNVDSIKRIDQKNRHKKELNYIKRRNSNLKFFKNKEIDDKLYNQMYDSILVLEKQLKKILTNTRLKEINTSGKINLQTFSPNEMGYEMLDGLNIRKENTTILCTTNSIFFDFFKKQKKYELDNLSESDLENIFYCAFVSGYSITNFSSFKIEGKENIKAYGMIALGAQDTGPFTPNTLYVFASVNDNIYIMDKSIKKEIKQTEACINIWNSTYVSGDDQSEEKAWKKYCDCYRKNFKKDEQFVALKEDINDMLKLVID